MAARRILAIDNGFTVGWASGPADAAPRLGHTKPSGADLAHWLASYSDWFVALLRVEKPDLVGIEGGVPANTFKAVDVAEKMICMSGLAQLICLRCNVATQVINPMTVRKFVCGTGRAKDGEVMLAVTSLGLRPANSHEADAGALHCMLAGRKWRAARAAA